MAITDELLEQMRHDVDAIFRRGGTPSVLSDTLFGPRGYFSRFTQTREERRELVRTDVFQMARRRLTKIELQVYYGVTGSQGIVSSYTVPSERVPQRPASIQELVDSSKDDLMMQLFSYIGGFKSGNPLAPYLGTLAQIVCVEWNWPAKRSDPRYADAVVLAGELVEPLSESKVPFPFPVELLAAALVKLGLDNLCGCDSP